MLMERYMLASLLCSYFFFFSFFFPCYSKGEHPLSSLIDKAGRLRTYIVHVQRPKSDELLSDEDVEDWHRSFLPNVTLDSGKPRLVYSYRYAMSGFAARLSTEEVKAMESKEGFLRAQPSTKASFFTTYTPKFLGLSEWDGLWVESNMGAGVIIGVVDSGITLLHPSFMDDSSMLPPPPTKWKGTCGFRNKTFCNNKLIGAYAIKGFTPLDPEDNGHGTHVAGIAAGNFVANASVLGLASGTASGIAPKAHLAIYMSIGSVTVGGAIDRAIKDGVDILSLSLGPETSTEFVNDVYAMATLAAVRKNIFVCMAAGNSGPGSKTIVNGAPWQMTVGATSHDRRIVSTVRLENGIELEGQSGYQPSSSDNTKGSLVKSNFAAYHCHSSSFYDVDIKGKIVLCEFETGKFRDMSVNVKNAGGAGIIVMNSYLKGLTTFSGDHVIPAVHLNYTETRKIEDYFRNSNSTPTATILFHGTKFGARPSPTVAFFSSEGPFPYNGEILKPDILGPGVNILSAFPVSPGPDPNIPSPLSRFNFLSGTSMATPHLSGVAALLKNTHKNWSPAAIRSAIMTTADRYDLDGNPLQNDYRNLNANVEVPATVLKMGAGQVNPTAANDPGLIYDITPDNYVQYLCGLGLTDSDVSVITGDQIQCSDVTSILPKDLNYPSIAIELGRGASNSVTRVLTNVGNANEVYDIRVEKPDGVSVDVSPSQLKFTGLGEKMSITVEFKSNGMHSDRFLEGQLILESPKHFVRSPIYVYIN